MNKFTQKWGIIALLEEIEEGSEFHYTDFPLHITLAGVFSIDKNGRWLANELAHLLIDQKMIEVKPDKKDMFGPNSDIAVMKMKKSAELLSIYDKIHNWLLDTGVVYNDPQYQGKGYVPHCTVQKSGILDENKTYLINSVSIIDLLPNNNGYQRRVVKTIKLE